jgi:citrate synthase
MSITTLEQQTNGYKPGLEGVIAAETRLSRVDGQRGELIIAGYALEELATRASFEEVAYLLWHGAPPNSRQLAEFARALAEQRKPPDATLALLRAAAARQRPVMDALRMAAGTLDLTGAADDMHAQARQLLAQMPTIVAAYWRLLHDQPVVPPDPTLGHAANYLYMLRGEIPDAAQVRGLETYLNTVVDHGLNASTFAARVIIATESDLVSAVVGALGALKGPRHGGAPGPALDMVFDIGQPERTDAYLRNKLERGERLMGFGHRVYKVYDPRAAVLAEAAATMYRASGDTALYDLAKHVEARALALLDECKPGRNLRTNVEFYTALLLHGLGLDTALFTPTFAISRTAGWIAHCFEQHRDGRIIRPASRYVGETGRTWTPLAERGGVDARGATDD